MKLARTLNGNYPYRTYVPVYDAADLVEGELVMRHASWAGVNKYYITAYTSANTEAEDSLGILMMSADDAVASKENSNLYAVGSDTLPDAGPDTGSNFLEAVVNPDATYYAFYDQETAKDHTHAESGTAITITSIEDNIDGGWIYSTNGQTDSSATNQGQLRYITADDGSDLTVDSSYTCDTSTDFIKVLPIGHRLTGLNAAATGMITAIAAETGVYLDIRENYITHNASAGRELMRYWNHKGLDSLTGVIIEAEIVQLRHCYRAVVA